MTYIYDNRDAVLLSAFSSVACVCEYRRARRRCASGGGGAMEPVCAAQLARVLATLAPEMITVTGFPVPVRVVEQINDFKTLLLIRLEFLGVAVPCVLNQMLLLTRHFAALPRRNRSGTRRQLRGVRGAAGRVPAAGGVMRISPVFMISMILNKICQIFLTTGPFSPPPPCCAPYGFRVLISITGAPG